MNLSRRDTVLGLGAALVFPTPALAKSASREFVVTFGKLKVGKSGITVSNKGSRTTASYFVDVSANLLVAKVRYGLKATEVWENGRLISLSSQAYENDKKFSVKGKAVSGGFEVKGTKFSGVVKGNPITTSYWTPEVLRRRTWISVQSGRPLNVNIGKAKKINLDTPAGNVRVSSYRCTGDLKRPVQLFYDARGEWVGHEFKVPAGSVRSLARSLDPAMAGLFNA